MANPAESVTSDMVLKEVDLSDCFDSANPYTAPTAHINCRKPSQHEFRRPPHGTLVTYCSECGYIYAAEPTNKTS
jgi:hypothetical protein